MFANCHENTQTEVQGETNITATLQHLMLWLHVKLNYFKIVSVLVNVRRK